MSEVKYPNIRQDVLFSIAGLADRGYQQRVWLDHHYPTEDYYDDFTEAVHTLYDDTEILTDPAGHIGLVLRSEAEAEAMRPLHAALERLFEALGTERSDAEYIGSPLWDDVVDAARRALAVLRADSPEAGE